MPKPGKTAVLVGATGLIGAHCLNLLLKMRGYERIVVLTRRQPNIDPDFRRLSVTTIDFDDPASYAHALAGDHIFCTLGTTMKKAGSRPAFARVDYTYVVGIARTARAQRARHFLVVSSLGANPRSKFFYNRVKGEMEEAVRHLDYPSLSIFRPSLLLGQRQEFRLGEELGKRLGFWLPGKYRPIAASDVARAMAQAALADAPGARIYQSDEIRRMVRSSTAVG